MSGLFSYFNGTFEEFLQIAPLNIGGLIKCKLDIPANDGFVHVIDNYAYRHIKSIVKGKCKNGNEALVYTKQIGEMTYTLIQEVRRGHKELAVSTLYKTRKKETHRR